VLAAALAVVALAVAVAFGARTESGDASLEETGSWPRAAPADAEVDESALRRLDSAVPTQYPDLLALLVARDGRLVFERYYNGAGPDDRFDLQSVTKTVVSTLVGIAAGDGRLSVDEPLRRVFPDQIAAARDTRIRAMPLRDLLRMTSGWDDTNPAEFAFAIDPVRVLLGRRLADRPGRRFAYDNGSYHLLSAAVTAATGKRASAYARERLWGPMHVTDAPWQEDDAGLSLGPGGLYLHARDLAKLGHLFLHGGRWGDRQLVPERYVREATKPQSEGGPPGGTRYGYGWWITSSPRGYEAIGYGGQILLVVPSLDLVVVALTDVAGQTDVGSLLFAVVNAVEPAS
jgi:CubicO group peptidase (beta-lactamase class C family)